MAQTNPYSQMTAEQRLRFALWLQEAEKQNTKVLKDLMVERGPIRYRDGNEGEYLADFVPVERNSIHTATPFRFSMSGSKHIPMSADYGTS